MLEILDLIKKNDCLWLNLVTCDHICGHNICASQIYDISCFKNLIFKPLVETLSMSSFGDIKTLHPFQWKKTE